MKIGILGGTFNPVHLGHLVLAEEIADILDLSKVIFVPAYIPVHKEVDNRVSSKHRYKMVQLAVEDNNKFEVSSFEINKKQKSYTVDTLKFFKKEYKNDKLFFIAGSDVLKVKWKDFSHILELARFVIVERPRHPLGKNISDKIKILKITSVDISSSEVRKRICKGKSIRYILPEKVIKYIKQNSLYSKTQ